MVHPALTLPKNSSRFFLCSFVTVQYLHSCVLSYFSPFLSSISSIVCHPSTAHLTRAGIWETSTRAPASSSSSISFSLASPLIIRRNRSAKWRASSSDFPIIRSSMISADAWEIAQPLPSKAPSTTCPSSTFN